MALLIAACTGADELDPVVAPAVSGEREVESLPTAAAAPERPSTPTPTTATSPTELRQAPEVIEHYRWRVSFDLYDSETGRMRTAENVASISVDRSRGAALMAIDAEATERLGGYDFPGDPAVVFLHDAVLVRGYPAEALGWEGPGEPDPELWHDIEPLGSFGLPDILPEDGRLTSLLAELGVVATGAERIEFDMETAEALTEAGVPFIAALERVSLEPRYGFWLDFEVDDAGRVLSWIQGSLDAEDHHRVDARDRVMVRIDYDAEPVQVPPRDEVVAVPKFTEQEREIAEILNIRNEVALQLSARDPDTGPEVVNVILTPRGELITLEWAGPWAVPTRSEVRSVTQQGMERMVAAVLDNPAVQAKARGALFERDIGLTIGSGRGGFSAAAEPVAPDAHDDLQDEIAEVITLLLNPTWLGPDVESQARPWAPERVAITAQRNVAPIEADWAFDERVTELGTRDEFHGEYQYNLCLEGEDAAIAWGMLMAAESGSSIAVNDGEPWTLHYDYRVPGYPVLRDHCNVADRPFLEFEPGE
ncbi:MAG: hypothetical protein AAF567_04265 [Actinomycetota bacterium]